MNIFFLSYDPYKCAQQTCDKHVVKMIVETAQLLSSAHHVLDGDKIPPSIYKCTHKNHPSAIWTRSSDIHYSWLWLLLYQLCKEYTFRYGKIHKVEREGLLYVLKQLPNNIAITTHFSAPPPAMPDQYKDSDVITSYRNYYRGAKRSFARWTNRNIPSWFCA